MIKKFAIFCLISFLVMATYFFLPLPNSASTLSANDFPVEPPIKFLADDQNKGKKCDDNAFYIKKEMSDGIDAEVIDDRCNDLQIAIVKASSEGNVAQIRQLLGKGASANATAVDYGELTKPVVVAVQNNRTEVVKLFLDNGVDINTEYACCASTKSLLMIAVQAGDVPTVKLLISRGATTSYRDKYEGFDVFDLAGSINSVEINSLLANACEVSLANRITCRANNLKKLFR